MTEPLIIIFFLANMDKNVIVLLSTYNGEKFIQPSLIPLLNAKLIARDLDKEKLENLIKAINDLKETVGIKKTIKEKNNLDIELEIIVLGEEK